MANAHCYDGYCESIIENKEVTFTEKVSIVGGLILLVVLVGTFVFYGVSMGYYPDLTIVS